MTTRRKGNGSPGTSAIQPPACFRDGQPLFFEIWDANYGYDTFVGGFVVYPDGKDEVPDKSGDHVAEYTAKILRDWKEPQSISRSGFARVTVRFLERQASSRDKAVRKAAP